MVNSPCNKGIAMVSHYYQMSYNTYMINKNIGA